MLIINYVPVSPQLRLMLTNFTVFSPADSAAAVSFSDPTTLKCVDTLPHETLMFVN